MTMNLVSKTLFIETTRLALSILHGAISRTGGALPEDVRESMYAGLEHLETALRAAGKMQVK